MSDTTAAPQVAPGAGGTVAPAQPPAPPAPVMPPLPATVNIPSDKLQERLAEERSKGASALLAELGFNKPEDAKAFFKTAKDLQQAQMSEQEKLAARLKELEPVAQRLPILEGRIKALADREFAALPEAARTAIDKQAAGDPERRLALIDLMRDAGMLGQPQQPALPAAPLNTAPPANAPPPSNVRTKFVEWDELRRDPAQGMRAALFYQAHRTEIERTRPPET